MNQPSVESVRALLQSGLTVRDVAETLRVHERAIAAVCLCRVTEIERHEDPHCPRHVLTEQARRTTSRRGQPESLRMRPSVGAPDPEPLLPLVKKALQRRIEREQESGARLKTDPAKP